VGKIFISYRRSGSAGYVRALVNEIKRTFGESQAFLDMESIEAGADFAEVIEEAVRSAEVLLVVMGPEFLTVADERGRRRLEDPADFVRLEILTALQVGIPVIPVLLEDTPMPAPELFPEELGVLPRLQALRLSHARWDSDIDWLFRAIEVVTEEPRLARQYLTADTLAAQGRWREARDLLEAIAARRPAFRDVAERLQPLRRLAAGESRLGRNVRGWARFAARFPTPAMLAAVLAPNLLAAAFNHVYNWRVVIHPMQERGVAQAESLFLETSNLVNGIGFALGIAVFAYLSGPVRRALAGTEPVAGERPAEAGFSARRRCLTLGWWSALAGAALWLAAGPVYPILIGGMEWRDVGFFTASLFFCGLIASAYPFFGVTWLSSRVFYPGLVQPGAMLPEDFHELEKLERTSWNFLVLAGALPMLAIATGLVMSPFTQSTDNAFLLGILGLGGFGGFLAAIGLFRAIQGDLAVLKELASRSTPSRTA
jgi:hypothetical protein